MWTHIIGAIHIDTFKEFSQGRPRQIDVTIEDGYNTYEDDLEYQTCAIITLCGDVHNYTIEEVKEEVAALYIK